MGLELKELFQRILEAIEIRKKLWEGDVHPKEVLENQIKFKLDLIKIKKGRHKSEGQISAIQNITDLFDIREK